MLNSANIEAKWRVPDLQAILRRAKRIGAVRKWTRRQRDVFFRVPRGRLKLRFEEDAGSQLIAYIRSDQTSARESRYTVVPVRDGGALRQALSVTLVETCEIAKRRTLLVWENVRIHLDRVRGLGDFVELEAVVDSKHPPEDCQRNIDQLIAQLGLREMEAVPVAYADLLQGQGNGTRDNSS